MYFWVAFLGVKWGGQEAPPILPKESLRLLLSPGAGHQDWVPPAGAPDQLPSLPPLVLTPVSSEGKLLTWGFPAHSPQTGHAEPPAGSLTAHVSNLCFLLCLELGLGPLKAPKDTDEGGRASSGSARKGKRQHSSPQNPLLDCSLCGKVFSSASSLSKHYLTHSQERKHVCKICSKAFKRQDHLYVGVWS